MDSQYNNEQRLLIWCHSDYCNSTHWDAEKSNMSLVYVKFTKLYGDRCIDESVQCLCSICKALLGFTVTLQSHCVPGCPPVSQWLDPLWACLPACGHLFTSSSISRHGCKLPPPLLPPDPSPRRPAFSTPLSCFPQTPAVNHLCLSCSPPHSVLSYRRPAQHSF